ncbi:protein YLS9-like, partial [Trifolium medium]|nr:protein YLS9-like [Trifolium medium]
MAMNSTAKSKWIFRAMLGFASGVVTEASLSKFNLTSNNTLSYKFEADVTLRNPNKNVEEYHSNCT